MTTSAESRTSRPLRPVHQLLIIAVLCTIHAALAVARGQNQHWDLRQYHFYNAYAYLHDRYEHDLSPAQKQNFYAPMVEVPFYLLVRSGLPPIAVTGILGAVHGLNLWLVLLLLAKVYPGPRSWRWWLMAMVLAGAVIRMPEAWRAIGGVNCDNLASLPYLVGILLLLEAIRLTPERFDGVRLSVAGALVGAAVGLKLTQSFLGVGALAAAAFTRLPLGRRFGFWFLFGFAAFLGMLAVSGGYYYHIWQITGNPTFPLNNRFFQSDWIWPIDFREPEFLVPSLRDYFIYPLRFAFDSSLVSNFDFTSPIAMVLYILFLLVGMATLIRRIAGFRIQPSDTVDDRLVAPLVALVVVSYLMWQFMMSFYRFLLVLEFLSPIMLLILFDRLVHFRPAVLGLTAATAVGCALATTHYTPYGTKFGTDWFGVRPPDIADPANTVVIMPNYGWPYAYLIPFFDPRIRFVRPYDWSSFPHHGTGFQRRVRELLDTHQGHVFAMFSHREGSEPVEGLGMSRIEERLALLGFTFEETVPFRSNYGPYHWAALQRIEPVSSISIPPPGDHPAFVVIPPQVQPPTDHVKIGDRTVRGAVSVYGTWYPWPDQTDYAAQATVDFGPNAAINPVLSRPSFRGWSEPYKFSTRNQPLEIHFWDPTYMPWRLHPFQTFRESLAVNLPMREGPEFGTAIELSLVPEWIPGTVRLPEESRIPRYRMIGPDGQSHTLNKLDRTKTYRLGFASDEPVEHRTAAVLPFALSPPSGMQSVIHGIEVSIAARSVLLPPPPDSDRAIGWAVQGEYYRVRDGEQRFVLDDQTLHPLDGRVSEGAYRGVPFSCLLLSLPGSIPRQVRFDGFLVRNVKAVPLSLPLEFTVDQLRSHIYEGLYAKERMNGRPFAWSNGRLLVLLPVWVDGVDYVATLTAAAPHPSTGTAEVRIGDQSHEFRLSPRITKHRWIFRGLAAGVADLEIATPTWMPAGDPRELGLQFFRLEWDILGPEPPPNRSVELDRVPSLGPSETDPSEAYLEISM